MNKFTNKYKLKKDKDTAASSTIEFIFALIFLLMLTISVIDMSCYFLNRNIVSNSAVNGARLVSLYGGVGNKNEGTPISNAYGAKIDPSCVNKENQVVCAVESELKASNAINMTVQGIECGPTKTKKIGERTYCAVQWYYPGLPGSAFSFIKTGTDKKPAGWNIKGASAWKKGSNATKMSAESEVSVK